MDGWIKLHRQILDWEWADDAAVFSTWVHLILMANHEDRKWRGAVIPRGSLITSVAELSKKIGVSVSQMRTALRKLKSTNEIAIETTNQYTIITICKYDSYQLAKEEDDTPVDKQNDKPIANESQTDDKQIATNKKEKKERREEDIVCQSERPDRIDYEPYFTAWNTICTSRPKVTLKTDKRKQGLRSRIDDMKRVGDPLEVFRLCCQKIQDSDFLSGRSGRWAKGADFDWLALAQGNWVKVYEGNYDEKKNTRQTEIRNNPDAIWDR